MGNNSACKVLGIGDVRLSLNDGGTRILTEVRYIPELKRNLISLGTLDSGGCSFKAQGGVLKVTKGSMVILKGEKKNGFYVSSGSAVLGSVAVSHSQNQNKTVLWHNRLGHISEKGLVELSKQKILEDKLEKLGPCEHCIYGKMSRVRFKHSHHVTKSVLDYIHTDV